MHVFGDPEERRIFPRRSNLPASSIPKRWMSGTSPFSKKVDEWDVPILGRPFSPFSNKISPGGLLSAGAESLLQEGCSRVYCGLTILPL